MPLKACKLKICDKGPNISFIPLCAICIQINIGKIITDTLNVKIILDEYWVIYNNPKRLNPPKSCISAKCNSSKVKFFFSILLIILFIYFF